MIDLFESIINALLWTFAASGNFVAYDPRDKFGHPRGREVNLADPLNSAFLVSMAGPKHPSFSQAQNYLQSVPKSDGWKDVVDFYSKGLSLVREELEKASRKDPKLSEQLKDLAVLLSKEKNLTIKQEYVEKLWSLFFPEGAGIINNEEACIDKLRAKRCIDITQLSSSSLTDPLSKILFTSNVLLTIPSASTSLETFKFNDFLNTKLEEIIHEDQLYWYDHPIQLGVDQEKNEIIYGLRGLDEAMAVEKNRGNVSADSKMTCVLSVSVTHKGLQQVARSYLNEALTHAGGLNHIDVLVFTEAATKEIIDTVLGPASEHYLQASDRQALYETFGVDGEYGRHYSFLKAIAAYWKVFIQQEIQATFKIDLDQIFPQENLIRETGASALEHLMSPLWGATGIDSAGNPVELGMIAGALVNQQDIEKSLFTPDVTFPHQPLAPDEHIFLSTLPQALSTEAEMMTRYQAGAIDGKVKCLQRIHVTGGTVGIRVDCLRKYRPFTPSFIGRAEDQAYILSAFNASDKKLAYVHMDGLIMRHDKADFAQEAIATAYIGKLVGDYIRILNFSAYAEVLTEGDIQKIKEIVDPFTGCFISRIPVTVVYMRFALKAASFFAAQEPDKGIDFVKTGAPRIRRALEFIGGEDSALKKQYERERSGWNLFYDTLEAVEKAVVEQDDFALGLIDKAKELMQQYLLQFD